MEQFNCRNKKVINNIEVALYDVDLGKEEELNDLKNWLHQKIKNMNMHKTNFIDAFNVPTITEEYRRKIKEKYSKHTSPERSKVKWFDVRRSRVTEFMAQRLLEKQYNCLFYEEADKRMTMDIIDRDKHAGGIDVTGIRKKDDEFKFVICEVKASSDNKIPCSSANSLLEDINKSFYDESGRTTREIMHYFESLHTIFNEDDQILCNIVEFLFSIINEFDNKSFIENKVVFFPFIIRNNNKVCKEYCLDDFSNFKNEDFKNTEMKGIIWAFNTDIEEFVEKIYDEVENV